MSKSKPGYRPRRIPFGMDYCVYCHGAGCEKCGGTGTYCPDTQVPVRPRWERNAPVGK